MIAPKWAGKIAYITTYPFILKWLHGSTRVYAVLQYKETILVTKNWLGLHKKWRLPGGGLEEKETLAEGLARELAEELGLVMKPSDATILHKGYFDTKVGYRYHLFLINYSKKPQLHQNRKELVAMEWLPKKNLHSMPVSTELEQALLLLK